jgi:hypothetical protein
MGEDENKVSTEVQVLRAAWCLRAAASEGPISTNSAESLSPFRSEADFAYAIALP